jgi:Ion channel
MTTRPAPTSAPAGRRLRARDRAGLLLLILVFTYLLSAFVGGLLISTFQILLFLAVVLISLRNAPLRRGTLRTLTIGLVAGSVVAGILQVLDRNGPGAGVANIWTGLILLVSAALIVRRVLARPEISLQSIYGALSAYLILGLMYAAFFAAMYHFDGDTFFAQRGHVGDTRLFQYFSFVTLTTTGYGDYTAAASSGQAVAVLEAITGQIFLATLVARLVAGFRGAARAAPRGPAGARRASTRRAGSSGLIGIRPPGTARRRSVSGKREAPPGHKAPPGPGR